MKTSPVAIALWVVNAGILAGGGWFVVKNVQEFRNERVEAFRTASNFTAKPKETWEDLKARDDLKLEFDRNLALTPGNPGYVPPPPVNPGGNGGTVAPPKPQVNIQPLIDAMSAKATKMIVPEGPAIGNGKNLQAQVKVDLRPEADVEFLAFFRPSMDLKSYAEDSMRKAAGKFPFDECFVHEITPSRVVLRASTPALREELRKAKDVAGGPKLVEDMIRDGKLLDASTFALLNVETMADPPIDLNDIYLQLTEGGPDATPAKPGTGGPPGTPKKADTIAEEAEKSGLPNPAELKPVVKETTADEMPKDSKENADGSWDLGADVLNQATFDDLGQYASAYVDASGQQAGILVNSSLPEDASNAAYRMGVRRGDVIKKINGEPVRNMPEIQAVVSRLRNQGVTRFEVEGERNGVPMTKVFNAPKKKDAPAAPQPAGSTPTPGR